ncbi:hypothetical protein [Nocardiopsis valliformis]|uniref:hypothetical protein n=1 Tax=Nocardiopsis valliformis TaxID=239974 RepID=UPI00034B7E42|nr:hypothetical protein [Nocardiopsis valliformis]
MTLVSSNRRGAGASATRIGAVLVGAPITWHNVHATADANTHHSCEVIEARGRR